MIAIINQVLVTIPPEHMGLVEFFGMLTIGIAAGSAGML